MTLTLYHCRDARSFRPLWALEELGIDYTLVGMQFPPRYHHDGYKEINSLGTVPTLLDGDLVMTESSAMCQYLAEKYGDTASLDKSLRVGVSEPAYGEYLNWMFQSDATYTWPLALTLRYSLMEPLDRRQPQVVDDYKKWFLNRAKWIEEHLENSDYLCANRFTMADITVGYALFFSSFIKGLSEELGPNTKAYLTRLKNSPSFKQAQAKQSDLPALF